MQLLLCVQSYQHIYLGALYGLLVVKAVLVDDFIALAAGCIGPLKLARMTPRETAVFWGSKALYVAYFIALPAMRSEHSLAALIALWLISEMVAGWMFAFLFQVSATPWGFMPACTVAASKLQNMQAHLFASLPGCNQITA